MSGFFVLGVSSDADDIFFSGVVCRLLPFGSVILVPSSFGGMGERHRPFKNSLWSDILVGCPALGGSGSIFGWLVGACLMRGRMVGSVGVLNKVVVELCS